MLKLDGAARAAYLKGEISYIRGRLDACTRIIEGTGAAPAEQEALFWLLWDELHALLLRLGRGAR
jgi:hypothetical protein